LERGTRGVQTRAFEKLDEFYRRPSKPRGVTNKLLKRSITHRIGNICPNIWGSLGECATVFQVRDQTGLKQKRDDDGPTSVGEEKDVKPVAYKGCVEKGSGCADSKLIGDDLHISVRPLEGKRGEKNFREGEGGGNQPMSPTEG